MRGNPIFGAALTGLLMAAGSGWLKADLEKSERLYTQGKGHFLAAQEEVQDDRRQEKYEQALKLFEQAAAEKPPYPLAVYYWGVTLGKLDRWTEARDRLTEAAAILDKTGSEYPAYVPAYQDLGVALYNLSSFQEGLEALQKAEKADPKNGWVQYYKGLCHYQLAEYQGALESFRSAIQLDRSLARHALRALQLISEKATQPSLLTEVMATMRDIRMEPKKEEQPKPWELRFGLKAEYDSNVVLEPRNRPSFRQISDEMDFRVSLLAGGSYSFLQSPEYLLRADYDFLQTAHVDVKDFNLQAHLMRLQAGWRPSSTFHFGVEGSYYFYRLGGEDYLSEALARPYAGFFARPWLYSLVSYTVGDQNYRVSFFDPVRDGLLQEIRFRQYFLLEDFDSYFYAGYARHREDPKGPPGNEFELTGNEFELGALYPLFGGKAVLEASYSFRNDDYAFANSRDLFRRRRNDDLHAVEVLLRRPLSECLELQLSYRGYFNNSNIPAFEYSRNIASAGLLVTF